jgi:hypothetical protein
MWNLIPQLFYDFLARIVPGATLILFSALVVFSPMIAANFILNSQDNSMIFAVGPLLLWILGSYLIGFILGQLWEITIGRFTKQAERQIEAECKQECLKEYNKFQKALGHPELDIEISKLPRAFIMRDHLRHVAPSDASRLLKVRAERRLCQVLILGFIFLGILNAVYILMQLKMDRVILEIFLIIMIIACWSRTLRLHKHFENGTIASWLIYASSGQIPVQKTNAKSS